MEATQRRRGTPWCSDGLEKGTMLKLSNAMGTQNAAVVCASGVLASDALITNGKWKRLVTANQPVHETNTFLYCASEEKPT